MPLIKNFQATDVWKAFILNSLLTSIVILVSITLKQSLDNYVFVNNHNDDQHDKVVRKSTSVSILFTLFVTFVVSMISYTIMYFIFGYGGGMIVQQK
jgi:heme/copper-type cytochrome/quinol oxidase subunit 2